MTADHYRRIYARRLAVARASLAEYPQYDDAYWAQFHYLIRIRRRVRGKGGIYFEPGDIVLARKDYRLPGQTASWVAITLPGRRMESFSVAIGDYANPNVLLDARTMESAS